MSNRHAKRTEVRSLRQQVRGDIITHLIDAHADLSTHRLLRDAVAHWRGNIRAQRLFCVACRTSFVDDAAQAGAFLLAEPINVRGLVATSALCEGCWRDLPPDAIERVATRVLRRIMPEWTLYRCEVTHASISMSDLAHAMRNAAAVSADDIDAVRGDDVWSIRFLKSPVFTVLTRSAVQVLAKITIERAAGRFAVTHAQFCGFGIDRGVVAHAIAELEALGVIRVSRCAAHANLFDFSMKWCAILSTERAKHLRDHARHFGIIRRRKIERQTARLDREQRLTWIKAALDAPQAPALAELDDVALKVLQAIVTAIEHRTPINYSTLCAHVGIGRQRVATSLRRLRELGLIEITRGRRRSVYSIGAWRIVGRMQARET